MCWFLVYSEVKLFFRFFPIIDSYKILNIVSCTAVLVLVVYVLYVVVCACMLSRVQLFTTLWTGVCHAPLFMGFSRENLGVGCHFLLQGIFLTQGLNWRLLHWQVDSLPWSPGKPCI